MQEIKFTKISQCNGEPWPVGRAFHAACCLGYGSSLLNLLITGGVNKLNKVLKDVWLLDISTGRWKEVSVNYCTKE